MKKLGALLCALLLGVFVFVGCSGDEDANFKHDTKTYEDSESKIEMTVKNIEKKQDNSVHIAGAGCLEFEIEVNNKSTSDSNGFSVYLYDFNFYFTKPQSIYEMRLSYPESSNDVERIIVRNGGKQTIILRVYYNNRYNDDFEVEDDCFVLKFLDVRI